MHRLFQYVSGLQWLEGAVTRRGSPAAGLEVEQASACQIGRVTRRRGALVASVLEASWRASPAQPQCSLEDLTAVTPLLLSFGAGALGWWRLRHSDLRDSAPAFGLRQAYRLHSLQAALHQREIKSVIPHLQSAGIDPVLVKGWAVARLYPQQGLRPYGDLDLCVPPEQFSAARSALLDPRQPSSVVDLHDGFAKLDHLAAEELYERSVLVEMDGVKVRLLSPEDHLRLLCVHMLRHGVCRPLWLCDIGAALESRPADFDWDRCLTRNLRVADWVACAIGLVHQLLGVRVADTPVARRANNLPRWLIPTVIKQWEREFRPRLSIGTFLGTPPAAFRELPHHWPNGIEATINMRGSFSRLSRFPFQIGDTIRRTGAFLADVFKLRSARR
jgi:hypothetical protein